MSKWLVFVVAPLAHGAISAVGIALSGYRRVDLRSRGRVVVFLQTTGLGQKVSRAIRWLFLPLVALTVLVDFEPIDHHATILRIVDAALFGLLALVGPLAFAALSYRRWLTVLLVIAGAIELLQISPNVPGSADAADFLTIALAMLMTAGGGLYLKWFDRQDFEDTALWARPWVATLGGRRTNAKSG